MSFTLFHNPRCSKSRQALALLEAHEKPVNIRQYLDETPSREELKSLFKLLGLKDVRLMMRKGEEAYKAHNLSDAKVTQEQLLDAIVEHPKLLERPILVKGNEAARIGRPPEIILEIL